MPPKNFIKKTKLNKADTKSESLKTIVPIEIARKHGFKIGTEIYWDELTLKDGSLIDSNGKKVETKGVEQIIVIRS